MSLCEENSMKKISLKFTKLDVVAILTVVALIPFLSDFETWFLYQLEKNKVEGITQKKVVVFYDNFDVSHGQDVVNVFLEKVDPNNFKQDEYKLIKINSKNTHVKVMGKLVEHLLENNKTVFFNSSISPKNGFASYERVKVYKELLEYENITITQAAGNNIYTASITNEKFDDMVYNSLNNRKDEILKIALNENDCKIVEDFGSFGKEYVLIKELFGFGRNYRMKKLVQEVVEGAINKRV